jgi:hypothetical protein
MWVADFSARIDSQLGLQGSFLRIACGVEGQSPSVVRHQARLLLDRLIAQDRRMALAAHEIYDQLFPPPD